MIRKHPIGLSAVAGLVLGLTACGGQSDIETSESGLRQALTRPTEELELLDMRSRAIVASQLVVKARQQIEAGEIERVSHADAETPVDAVARADAERELRQADPLVVAVVRSEEANVTIEASGQAELLDLAIVNSRQRAAGIRVDEEFALEPSEALNGRSELVATEDLSGFIAELGASVDPDVSSWTVMRQPSLKAGLVFLVDEGIVELNPNLLYYIAAVPEPGNAVAEAPAAVGDPDQRPRSSDWEIFVNWLEEADPGSWTNLNTPPSQTFDGGASDPYGEEPPPIPSPCCCGCSASGLGLHGKGIALYVLPLVLIGLFVLRRGRQ